MLVLGYYVYSNLRTSEIKEEVQIENPFSQAEEPVEARSFTELATIANSGDQEKTKKAALEVASNTNEQITLRLDAYRLCIQTSRGTNDASTQQTCYDDAKKLLEQSTNQEDKIFWLEYLDKVNAGKALEQVDDGQR